MEVQNESDNFYNCVNITLLNGGMIVIFSIWQVPFLYYNYV